ncbi:MAG: SpoIIIAC/SpoIIIAD family protein [Lachnospiraceae bacterium]
MDIIKIGILGVAGVLLAMPLKQQKPEFSILIGLAVCLCIFVYILCRLEGAWDTMLSMIQKTGIQMGYVKTLLKMLGVTYISEFSSDICREAGHTAIAAQIEMFAKISLFALSMPILMVLMQTIGDFL